MSYFNYYYFYNVFLHIDKGVLELLGPTGLARSYLMIVKVINKIYRQSFSQQLMLIYNTILAYLFVVEFFF